MVSLRAKDIMTRDVLEAKSGWSLRHLAQFFVENAISGAPVISDKGKLIGVVSVTDILCHDLLPQKESESHGPHDFYLHTLEEQFAVQDFESLHLETEPQITVQDVMTQKIFQVDHEDTIQAVAAHMIKNHIHRVFVTQNEKVVGIISAVDMLKIIRDL